MIQTFVDRFMKNKHKLEKQFSDGYVSSYLTLVKMVIEIIKDDDDDITPDPTRIHEIDDGHYQGALLFIIASTNYQPNDYWYVKVDYGSCSGCDTLQAIACNIFDQEKPTEEQIKDYMSLALHIVQRLKFLGGD